MERLFMDIETYNSADTGKVLRLKEQKTDEGRKLIRQNKGGTTPYFLFAMLCWIISSFAK